MWTSLPITLGPVRGPSTHTQGGALFSQVPLVWEWNPKLQGGWCKPNHQPFGGSDPEGDLEPQAGHGDVTGWESLESLCISDAEARRRRWG